MLEQPLRFYYLHPVFSVQSQLGYTWYPIPNCVALVLLSGNHIAVLVNRYCPPCPYLGK